MGGCMGYRYIHRPTKVRDRDRLFRSGNFASARQVAESIDVRRHGLDFWNCCKFFVNMTYPMVTPWWSSCS